MGTLMDLNDQLLSLRQWVYNLYSGPITAIQAPYANLMKLETEGRVRNFTRPQWSIDRLNHRVVDLGSGGYRDDCLWQLTYYGLNRVDADLAVSNVHHTLQNDSVRSRLFNRIPGYRFNWQYPQPEVLPNVVTPGPGLPAGQYSVRVSGIDRCGVESAASQPVLVTLAAPSNSLWVRILRAPFMVPVFTRYNIYVNNHLEVADIWQPGYESTPYGPPTLVGGANTVYATAVLSNLLGTGAAPKEPANSNAVRWKWIRVNMFSDALQEDDEEDGIFNGLITMETSVMQERDQPQPDVVRKVNISMKVYGPQPAPIRVAPYNITSVNPFIVNVSAG